MQPWTRTFRSLTNKTLVAAGVKSDGTYLGTPSTSALGFHTITDPDGKLVIPPIRQGTIKEIVWKNSQAEKQQFVLIAGSGETIVADTSYSVGMKFPRDRMEGGYHELRIFRTRSPESLTSAAVDRKNVYEALAEKINAYVPMFTKAKLSTIIETISAGASTPATITKGTLIYEKGASEGWVGMVCEDVTPGADGDDLNITVATIRGGEMPTAGDTPIFALGDHTGDALNKTSVSYVESQGLVIYDEEGYFPTKERLGRGGAPTIYTRGFSSNISLLQAHQYSKGIGTDMLAHTPEFDLTRQNMTAGDFDHQYSESPVSGNTYREYTLRLMGGGIPDAIDGRNADIMIEHTLYVKENVDSGFHDALIALK